MSNPTPGYFSVEYPPAQRHLPRACKRQTPPAGSIFDSPDSSDSSDTGSEYHPTAAAAEQAEHRRLHRAVDRAQRLYRQQQLTQPSTESLFGSSDSSIASADPPVVRSDSPIFLPNEHFDPSTATIGQLREQYFTLLAENHTLETVADEQSARLDYLADRNVQLIVEIHELSYQLALERAHQTQQE